MLSFLIGLSVFLGAISVNSSSEVENHAIYVSVLEIEKVDKIGEIRIKIFADDLEDAIYNSSQKRIDLIKGDCNQNKILVSDYFAKHLQLNLDGTYVDYQFISCEVNDISIWFNYEFASMTTWSELEVKVDYLMELFPTQSNVVSVDYQGQKKFRLVKGDELKTISFNK